MVPIYPAGVVRSNKELFAAGEDESKQKKVTIVDGSNNQRLAFPTPNPMALARSLGLTEPNTVYSLCKSLRWTTSVESGDADRKPRNALSHKSLHPVSESRRKLRDGSLLAPIQRVDTPLSVGFDVASGLDRVG